MKSREERGARSLGPGEERGARRQVARRKGVDGGQPLESSQPLQALRILQ